MADIHKPHCRPGGNTRMQQELDTQSFFWITCCFVEEDWCLPRRRCLPHTALHSFAFACYSLPQSKTVLYCMSQFPMFQRFFLLHSPPVLDNIFCRIQIPMLSCRAFSFLCMLRSHILFCALRECERAYLLSFLAKEIGKFC